ncbi:MAG: RNase adapter RapZ [Myxococcota bacterium]
MTADGPRVIVVTGMSGAGRSTAVHVLEDLGFFCVDNLPPSLAPGLIDLLEGPEQPAKIAMGVDVRTGRFLEGAADAMMQLRERGFEVEILFLDAQDAVLVRRYSETRRPHPLAPGGDVLQAIQGERARLSSLRADASHVIDTTRFNVHALRRAIVDLVSKSAIEARMVVRLISFGFKYGIPVDADLVFDLRYLPNPHFVPELRPKTGLDQDVSDYVLSAAPTQELLTDLLPLLRRVLPEYEKEGKAYLTIAVGCTGGKHRSVALAEELGRILGEDREGPLVVAHRDVERGQPEL